MPNLYNAKNTVLYYGEYSRIVILKASNNDTRFTIDFDDFERVKNYRWSTNGSGYLQAYVGGEQVFLHRYVKNAQPGVIIDHKNCDINDNRKDNLRDATRVQNGQNKPLPKHNTSGFKGVSPKGRKWVATIQFTVNGVKQTKSASFDSKVRAAQQYNDWAREHHQEFARLNVINEADE